ncbi:MAG: zinc ribbon domain-containing protein [Gemmatimonadetes bacterium]|nr:zinc ribbon domain-containing protein [Gemmatimonadota bacterium]
MPIYEYRCQKCGELFTRVQHIDEHQRARPQCPKCRSRKVEQVFGPFFAKTSKKS